MLDMNRLAGQGSSALEVSGQSISKCSKNNKNILLNSMLVACGPHWDNVHPHLDCCSVFNVQRLV